MQERAQARLERELEYARLRGTGEAGWRNVAEDCWRDEEARRGRSWGV